MWLHYRETFENLGDTPVFPSTARPARQPTMQPPQRFESGTERAALQTATAQG